MKFFVGTSSIILSEMPPRKKDGRASYLSSYLRPTVHEIFEQQKIACPRVLILFAPLFLKRSFHKNTRGRLAEETCYNAIWYRWRKRSM